MDLEQDAFDLAVARCSLRAGRPLLAICRGMQVVNVAMGGTLVQDMPRHHRHVRSELALRPGTAVHGVLGQDRVTISCYHHQAVDHIGAGLRHTAAPDDSVVEAIELAAPGRAWFLAVQWHPEDTAADDPAQQRLFSALYPPRRGTAASYVIRLVVPHLASTLGPGKFLAARSCPQIVWTHMILVTSFVR
jgi:putative glutamine amidotransferase